MLNISDSTSLVSNVGISGIRRQTPLAKGPAPARRGRRPIRRQADRLARRRSQRRRPSRTVPSQAIFPWRNILPCHIRPRHSFSGVFTHP